MRSLTSKSAQANYDYSSRSAFMATSQDFETPIWDQNPAYWLDNRWLALALADLPPSKHARHCALGTSGTSSRTRPLQCRPWVVSLNDFQAFECLWVPRSVFWVVASSCANLWKVCICSRATLSSWLRSRGATHPWSCFSTHAEWKAYPQIVRWRLRECPLATSS